MADFIPELDDIVTAAGQLRTIAPAGTKNIIVFGTKLAQTGQRTRWELVHQDEAHGWTDPETGIHGPLSSVLLAIATYYLVNTPEVS